MITVSHEETKAGKYTLKINTVNNSLAISLEYHVLNHNKYSIELNEFTYPQLSELIKFSFGDKQQIYEALVISPNHEVMDNGQIRLKTPLSVKGSNKQKWVSLALNKEEPKVEEPPKEEQPVKIEEKTEEIKEQKIQQKPQIRIKTLFLGPASSGKTSIFNAVRGHAFDPKEHTTIGIDFSIKILQKQNLKIKMQMWDTAGQERFRTIIDGYIKDCGIVFIVFDLSAAMTPEQVKQWIDLVRSKGQGNKTIVIVGNKADLKPQAETREILKLVAEKESLKYLQLSAKNQNISKIYDEVENAVGAGPM